MYPIYADSRREDPIRSTGKRTRKYFELDAAKIKGAQKALGTERETETIERALDLVIAEYRRNRLVRQANDRFVQSGIEIKDVYGKLDH